jgi:hypothetical protein
MLWLYFIGTAPACGAALRDLFAGGVGPFRNEVFRSGRILR